MEVSEASPRAQGSLAWARTAFRPVLRLLPPARVAWLSLLIVGLYGAQYLRWIGIESLAVVPLVAAATDLVFQRVRFSRLRIPDAALTTGFLIALVLPPTAPLMILGALGFSAVTLRHALRTAGHPWLNSAVATILAGAVLFGLAPAWWVGIGPYGEVLMVGLGLLLLARSTPSRMPVAVFLASYGFLSVVQHVTVGATTDPRLLLLQVLDPATMFFAFFMVSEPRTAPGRSADSFLYAGVVGIGAALLPILFPSIGILIALIGANIVAVALRRKASTTHLTPSPSPSRRRRAASRPAAPSRATRWPIGYRVGAGFFAVVLLIAVVALSPTSSSIAPLVHLTPPGGGSGSGGGGSTAQCASDNPSIPSSTLSQLHQMLGPSVILSYDKSTGVVIFYDTANHVTVTETDLYEDYGFADFNGDDYAVNGCAP